MTALDNHIESRGISHLILNDNPITDYGMHKIRNILAKMDLISLNLASTQMSGEGFELLMDELVYHHTLTSLNIGSHEGSNFKNTVGIQGAVICSAYLIKNSRIEELILENNNMGSDGGEMIGISLSQN